MLVAVVIAAAVGVVVVAVSIVLADEITYFETDGDVIRLSAAAATVHNVLSTRLRDGQQSRIIGA